MKCKFMVFAAMLLLAACDGKNSVQLKLDDGNPLTIKGSMLQQSNVSGAQGDLKVNKFFVAESPKETEKVVAKEMMKLGYRRKVMEESDASYKVHYSKKDWPVVGALYTAQADDKAPGSRVSIYWKIN